MHFCGSDRQKLESRKDWARKVCRERCAHYQTLTRCAREWKLISYTDSIGCENFEEKMK